MSRPLIVTLLAGALLAKGAAALRAADASSEDDQANLRAAAWLHAQDGPPSNERLEALRMSDPKSYELVKALLAKQQLGLLNPEPKRPAGVAAFAKFENEGSTETQGTARAQVDLPYANVAEVAAASGISVRTQNSNSIDWRPQGGDDRDAQMVDNVLGTVASLRGSAQGLSPIPNGPERESPPPAASAYVEQPHIPAPVSFNAAALPALPAAVHTVDVRDGAVPSSLAADEALFRVGGAGSLEAMSEPQPASQMPPAPSQGWDAHAAGLRKQLAANDMGIPSMGWGKFQQDADTQNVAARAVPVQRGVSRVEVPFPVIDELAIEGSDDAPPSPASSASTGSARTQLAMPAMGTAMSTAQSNEYVSPLLKDNPLLTPMEGPATWGNLNRAFLITSGRLPPTVAAEGTTENAPVTPPAHVNEYLSVLGVKPKPVAPSKPKPNVAQLMTNSYLKGIDWSSNAPDYVPPLSLAAARAPPAPQPTAPQSQSIGQAKLVDVAQTMPDLSAAWSAFSDLQAAGPAPASVAGGDTLTALGLTAQDQPLVPQAPILVQRKAARPTRA